MYLFFSFPLGGSITKTVHLAQYERYVPVLDTCLAITIILTRFTLCFSMPRFEWSMPLSEVQQRTLDVQIKNKNSMFSKARVHMGQVVLNLGDLDLTKASTEW